MYHQPKSDSVEAEAGSETSSKKRSFDEALSSSPETTESSGSDPKKLKSLKSES